MAVALLITTLSVLLAGTAFLAVHFRSLFKSAKINLERKVAVASVLDANNMTLEGQVEFLLEENQSLQSVCEKYEEVVERMAGVQQESMEIIQGYTSRNAKLVEACEELLQEKSSDFEMFSYRTILRSTLMQLSANPKLILLTQHIAFMIEGVLRQIDTEWIEELEAAYMESLSNGDSTKLSLIARETARELALLQPAREGELAN